jgi:hypothetical protein
VAAKISNQWRKSMANESIACLSYIIEISQPPEAK